MALRKIEKHSVGDRVFDAVHEEILEGGYRAGERLPAERVLAEQLGVSIASVKVAMQRLVALGLVEMRRGEGNFVREFSGNPHLDQVRDFLVGEEEVSRITEYRFYVEMAATRLAMKRARKSDFAAMEKILRGMEKAAEEGDVALHGRLDFEFHREICRATGNDIFVKTYELIGPMLRSHAMFMNEGYFDRLRQQKPGEDLHWRLLRAIREGDIHLARRCYAEMFSVYEAFPEEHLSGG